MKREFFPCQNARAATASTLSTQSRVTRMTRVSVVPVIESEFPLTTVFQPFMNAWRVRHFDRLRYQVDTCFFFPSISLS